MKHTRAKSRRGPLVVMLIVLLITPVAVSGCGRKKVPNVVGMTGDEAVHVLQDAGYDLGTTSTMYTSSYTPGTIIEQNPAAGERLNKRQAVDVKVAKSLGSITVPDLSGMTEAEATSLLATTTLVAVPVASYSETVPAGTVGGQVPSAGSQVNAGATVAIAVSKGKTPPKVKVPKVSGMKQADAEAAIEKAGLVPDPYPTYSDTIAKGVVGDQSPAAGASVSPDSKVGFIVSQGKGTTSVTVPNVKGKTSSDAKAAIESAGLKYSVTSQPDDTVKKDIVISQMPPSGTTTAKGGTVGIYVSTGPKSATTVAVPNLSGLSANAAKDAVEKAGFYAYAVHQVSTEPSGTVFNQLPAAGAKVPAGWPVIYAISSGTP